MLAEKSAAYSARRPRATRTARVKNPKKGTGNLSINATHLAPILITGRGSETGRPSALQAETELEPALPSYVFALTAADNNDNYGGRNDGNGDHGDHDDEDSAASESFSPRLSRARHLDDDHRPLSSSSAFFDMRHPGFPPIKPLPYAMPGSVDPIALLVNGLYAELADIHSALGALAPAAQVVSHALVRELYSWLGRGAELATRLLDELFAGVLPALKLPTHVFITCERRGVQARRAIAALARSREAFTTSLPAGERLPVLMRAAARLRDVVSATTDIHSRVQAALRLSPAIYQAGHDKLNSQQASKAGLWPPAKRSADLVRVERASWKRLVGSVRTDRHGKGIAMPALLTRWMSREQLNILCRRHARGLRGFRIENVLTRMQRNYDAQHRFIPCNIDKIIAEERAEVLKYNRDSGVSREQWLEATRLSRLYAEEIIRNNEQLELCPFQLTPTSCHIESGSEADVSSQISAE
jgi:hypothetical protein